MAGLSRRRFLGMLGAATITAPWASRESVVMASSWAQTGLTRLLEQNRAPIAQRERLKALLSGEETALSILQGWDKMPAYFPNPKYNPQNYKTFEDMLRAYVRDETVNEALRNNARPVLNIYDLIRDDNVQAALGMAYTFQSRLAEARHGRDKMPLRQLNGVLVVSAEDLIAAIEYVREAGPFGDLRATLMTVQQSPRNSDVDRYVAGTCVHEVIDEITTQVADNAIVALRTALDMSV